MQAVFLDSETTGIDPLKHRLLDIAFKIIDLPTGREKLAYQAIIKQPKEVWERRDLTSIEINGFTWEKMESGKEERAVAEEIAQLFSDYQVSRKTTVYICQNPAFDRNFFAQLISVQEQEKKGWPYHWLDLASMYWALEVQAHIKSGKPCHLNDHLISKNAIAKHYGLPIESLPHSAINGVNHLLLCYRTAIGFA